MGRWKPGYLSIRTYFGFIILMWSVCTVIVSYVFCLKKSSIVFRQNFFDVRKFSDVNQDVYIPFLKTWWNVSILLMFRGVLKKNRASSLKTNAFNFRHHICWAYLNFSKNLEPFSEKSHLRQEWLTGLSFTDSIKRNCPGYNVRMYWTDFWQPNNKIFLKKFF